MKAAETLRAEIALKDYLPRFVAPEKTLPACRACPNYRQCWSCPDYDFDVMAYWSRYRTLRVRALKLYLEDVTPEAVPALLREAKEALFTSLLGEERQFPGSAALAAGLCEQCASCARPLGLPCRQPERLRYSIESLGGDVTGTLRELFGLELQWMRGDALPDYLVLVGGLLVP